MKCNNNLCIHNFGKECELEEIKIDWRGNCENMQHVYFTNDTISSNKLFTQAFLDYKLKYNKTTGDYIYLRKEENK